MAIKRYTADADNSITDAYKSNLTSSGSLANMGESDVVEVFSIFAQANSSSLELTRILTKFPISTIVSDRAAGTIPISGSTNFILKLTNAVHGQTLPTTGYLLLRELLGRHPAATTSLPATIMPILKMALRT